jgi:hypothetical protein
MGLKQFDPIQIIFIMMAQTMIVPAGFTIADFSVNPSVPERFSALSILVVVIFLPLTTIWAKFKYTANPGEAMRLTPSFAVSHRSSYTCSPPSPTSKSNTVLRNTFVGTNTVVEASHHHTDEARKSPTTPLSAGSTVVSPHYYNNKNIMDDDDDAMYDYDHIMLSVGREARNSPMSPSAPITSSNADSIV